MRRIRSVRELLEADEKIITWRVIHGSPFWRKRRIIIKTNKGKYEMPV